MEKIEDKKKGLIGKIFSTKSKKDNFYSSDHLLNWEFIIDFEGNYLNVSHEVQQCLGISPDEFNNQSIFTFSVNPFSGENLFKKFSNRVFPLDETIIFDSIDNKQISCNLKLTKFVEEYNQKPTYIGLVQVVDFEGQNRDSENNSQVIVTEEKEDKEDKELTSHNGHRPQVSIGQENLDRKKGILEEKQLTNKIPVGSYFEIYNQFSIEVNHLIDPIEIYKLSFDVLNQIFPEDDILLAIQNKENKKIELPILKEDNEILYFQEDHQYFEIILRTIHSKLEVADALNALSIPNVEVGTFTYSPTSYFATPIICGNCNLGAFLVFNDRDKEFETDKLITLKKISTSMGYALENANFFHEMQNALAAIDTREKYQNLIIQAIKIISIDGLENLTKAFEMLGKVTNTQRIFLAQPEIFKPQKNLIITHQWVSENKFDTSHLTQQLPNDYFDIHSSRLWSNGYLKVDYEKLESPFYKWLEMRNTNSILFMAITLANNDFCVLALEDLYQNHLWKNEEISYLRTIAEILSQKIVINKNFSNLNQKLYEEEKFLEIINVLNNIDLIQYLNRDFSFLTDHIQNLLKDSLEADSVIIHFVDQEETNELTQAVESLSNLIEDVIKSNSPMSLTNAQSDRSLITASICTSHVITPIKKKFPLPGVVIYIYNKEIEFDDYNIQNHQLVTDKISLLFEKYQLQKENEELKLIVAESEDLKNKFISNISHEFRTPLNSIIGFSKVILTGIDGPINDTQKQDLSTIYTSGQTLLRMVNDILDISKIESGNLTLDKTKTEIKSFINSLLPEIEEIVNEKVIEYELFVEENLPEIHLDRNRIKQVLFHLISNATTNTEFGKVTLTVKYKLNMHNKPEIIFSVIDTGKGIEISDQKDLFKPFTLLSHHEKNRSAGSGLGLALSKAIIELHGGRIGVKSSIPGKGSEFFFTLPLK